MSEEPTSVALFGTTTGARVADYVRGLIWDGALRPGDRVRQEQIAAALGVSRIPVREGLVALESEGLVRHEPQRGVFVEALDADFIADHYALLGLVLGYVIEQATRRRDPAFVEQIDALADRVAAARTAEEIFPLAVRFKELVCKAGASARARAAVGAMERLVPGNLHARVPAAIPVTRSGIPAIARAIAAGEGHDAAEHTREMTRALAEAVAAELVRRGTIAAA